MRRSLRRRPALLALAAAVALLAPLGGAPVAQQTGEAPQPFVVYTQYNPTFIPGDPHVHFTVTAYVQNATRTKYSNLVFHRTFPEGFKVQPPSQDLLAQIAYPEGYTQKVENNAFTLTLPEMPGLAGTLMYYKLEFTGRPEKTLLSGMDMAYEAGGQAMSVHTPNDLVDFKPFSFFSGPLRDYIKRNAEISIDIGLKGDPWTMAAIESRGLGQNPSGITGIDGDLDKGHFRLQAGQWGSRRDLLVVWWPTTKEKRTQEEAAFRAKLREYCTWVGFKKLPDDVIKVTPERQFKNFKGWYAEGVWRDVPQRLGEGPLGAVLFYSPARDAEFMLFWWVQGRGMGPGKGDTPQPEKDTQLLRELEAIVDSFRPFRKA